MILGLTVHQFTQLHVGVSLVAIASGIVALYGALYSRRMPGWTALFLATTILTSVTGFMFPSAVLTPAQIFGYLSLAVLAVAVVALYAFRLRGIWRPVYVVTALLALYLNVFVLVVQGFQKVPLLHRFAPTGAEPAFFMAQGIIFLAFLVWGVLALRRFHPERTAPSMQVA